MRALLGATAQASAAKSFGRGYEQATDVSGVIDGFYIPGDDHPDPDPDPPILVCLLSADGMRWYAYPEDVSLLP